MAKKQLSKENFYRISKDDLFAIMGKLSIRQRAVLSLKYLERLEFGKLPYALEMGYFQVCWHLLTAHIRLKLLLMINGYRYISLKKIMITFGKLTAV